MVFVNPNAPLGRSQSLSQVSPSVQKYLQSEAFRSVLSGLGIKPGDIKGLVEQKGVTIKPGLSDVRLVQISQDTAQALSALGIPNAEVAIVLAGGNQIAELRKKLGQVRKSTLDGDDMQAVFEMLGVPFDEDGLVILDSTGGVIVVKDGLRDIEETL